VTPCSLAKKGARIVGVMVLMRLAKAVGMAVAALLRGGAVGAGSVGEGAWPVQLDAFMAAEAKQADQTRRLAEFSDLIPLVDRLYEQAVPVLTNRAHPIVALFFMLCHRGFLAAAATIIRGRPDDAGATTRRTIELVKSACAIRHDPRNLKRWLASEQRRSRWQARNTGTRSKAKLPALKYPEGHPVVGQLGLLEGVLSDAFVHFTPEQVSALPYGVVEGRAIRLGYLVDDPWLLRNQLSILASVHVLAFKIFDECLEGALSRDLAWRATYGRLEANARRVSEQLRIEEEARHEGQGDK
jgi:hypothetical protein